MKPEMKEQLKEYQQFIENYMDENCFQYDSEPQKILFSAMRYSLLAGGKRLRPVFVFDFCRMCGGDWKAAAPFAAAIEMVHTYSLIHDDLPCMDNDDLRRGKPTCHKVYGETVATLAGDALQAAAFRTVLEAEGPWDQSENSGPWAAAHYLAQAASEQGMCGGQYLDTLEEGYARTVEDLYLIPAGKTGALLRAACLMGVCASAGKRRVEPRMFDAAREYAEHLGLAFQIKDDILDVTSTTEVLGKPVGSDQANEKTTFVSLLGIDACEKLVLEHTAKAKEALNGVFSDCEFLCWLADELATRKN